VPAPLEEHLRKESELAKMRAGASLFRPPTRPASARPSTRHHGRASAVCELRDVTRLKERVDHATHPDMPLPELYISRKLNWPPSGLKLAPQVRKRTRPTPTPRGVRRQIQRDALHCAHAPPLTRRARAPARSASGDGEA
jgi:hypothetical protein